MKFKLGDYLIIVIVISAALLLMLPKSYDTDTVFLEVDGEVIKTFNLNTDTEYIYNGRYTNVIQVSNGDVFIKSATCPDQICVHSGKLSAGDKVICCLPNKLILRLEKNNTDADVISG